VEEREISKLKANPQNPRGAVEHDAAFSDLVASIKTMGVLQSVLITPTDLIVAGHRRVEAAEEAGLTSVPVVVKKLSKIEQLQAMLAENLQRADLNVLQEGAAYNVLVGYGLTVSQIAKAIGVKSQQVSDCIAVQGLTVEVQRQFAWGMLPVSCASPLVPLSPADQITWADRAIASKWNGAALRDAIKRPEHSNGHNTVSQTRLPHLRDMIRQLEEWDELLDTYEGVRPIQTLLRQAASQMIEHLQASRRKARIAK